MVLESLLNPFKAKTKPWELFLVGLLYASLGLILGNWIFQEHASLIMVFLTVMACIPLLYNTLKEEEKGDIETETESKMLKEHAKVLVFFLALFSGMVVAYSIWYIFLPVNWVQSSFRIQTSTIQSINTRLSGNFTATKTLTYILLNNMKVLIFCILFSFLYGAGAIFILTWNASVISAAIGNFVRTRMSEFATHVGFSKIANYTHIISLGFLRYMFHGILEIAAYFVAAIAGGIVSVAVIKENLGTRNFEKIILDSANLILVAVAILIVAAVMEVFITPLLV